MARYDESSGVTSVPNAILRMERKGPATTMKVRPHIRFIPDAPPPAERLQPGPLDRRPAKQATVSNLTSRSSLASAFNRIRLSPSGGRGADGIVSSLATLTDLPPALGTPISVFRMGDGKRDPGTTARGGTQAVARALDILDAVAERPMMLAELAERVGVSPPTCYRIAKAMAARGLLATSGRNGFALGARAEELGIAYKKQRKAASGNRSTD